MTVGHTQKLLAAANTQLTNESDFTSSTQFMSIPC